MYLVSGFYNLFLLACHFLYFYCIIDLSQTCTAYTSALPAPGSRRAWWFKYQVFKRGIILFLVFWPILPHNQIRNSFFKVILWHSASKKICPLINLTPFCDTNINPIEQLFYSLPLSITGITTYLLPPFLNISLTFCCLIFKNWLMSLWLYPAS